MTESENRRIEKVVKSDLFPLVTQISAVELVDERVGHGREPPDHSEGFGDISVFD